MTSLLAPLLESVRSSTTRPTPLSYRHPNTFSFPYFVCRVADPYTSPVPRCLLQAYYVRLRFDPSLQRRNGPLGQPGAVMLDGSNHW